MQYLMFLIGIVLGVLIIKIFNRKIEKSIKLKKYNRYMFWVAQALLAAVVLKFLLLISQAMRKTIIQSLL